MPIPPTDPAEALEAPEEPLPDVSMFALDTDDHPAETALDAAARGGEAPAVSGEFMPNPYGSFESAARAVDLDPYVVDCVDLDLTRYNEEFARLPNDLARWNELHTRAHEAVLEAKAAATRTRSRRALELRRTLAARATVDKTFKLTESVLQDTLNTDAEVIATEDALTRADVLRTRIRGVLAAVSAKGTALVSVGAQLRAEKAFPEHLNTPERARRRRGDGQ